ncbi:hypothetical protein [Haliangium sp.]|uniref:hypothetical protein n=1 Tax=Haliangium sp. TaxID=2663208 RepID=UPI003D134EB2
MSPRKKQRVLWIEDSARFELASVLGPIFASRRYDLTLAENATTAAEYLRRRRFDAIVVDVRLPPGTHAYWRDIYQNAGADRTNAKLGLALLAWLFGAPATLMAATGNPDDAPVRPTWPVPPQHVGVFSVENHIEIGPTLEALGINVMHEKRPGLPDTILLEIVAQVLAQSVAQVGPGTAAPGPAA